MITPAGNLVASSPIRDDQDDQNDFNELIIEDLETLRREGLGRKSSFIRNGRTSESKTVNSARGAVQYIGVFSPDEEIDITIPLEEDIKAMDSLIIADEGKNASNFPINILRNGNTIESEEEDLIIENDGEVIWLLCTSPGFFKILMRYIPTP